MTDVLILAGDLFILLGLVAMTVALLGLWRFRTYYARLHAAAKIGSVGLSTVLLGSLSTTDPWLVLQGLWIVLFAFFTAPVTTYALARAARAEDRTEPGQKPP